ncbi:nucleotidyltransferase family protein [Donghicola sp. C2-DW-16]|uniref:Nucleotidyltransferase family protein n=1 Tax=Donghicola mangrovi TaxID=2729614 RepID=A0ABX2PJA1_9RHOB|nr:nucleotidyltransferase family protein [Donghicola mangrovi]
MLFDAARLNKVVNLIASPLQNEFEVITSLQLDLEKVKLLTIALNSRSLDASLKASKVLKKAKITHAVFKGPAQQDVLYGSAFVKPSADADILVAPKDQERAFEALQSYGYHIDEPKAWWWRQFLNEVHLVSNDKAPLDLHHGLGQAGLPDVRNPEAFLDRTTQYMYRGDHIPILDKIDICMLASYSLAKSFISQEPCLGTLFDFHTARSSLNAEEYDVLKSRSAAHKLSKILSFGESLEDAVFRKINSNKLPFKIETESLAGMAVTPWEENLPWPKRRHILRQFSDGTKIDLLCDATWATFAHVTRIFLDRKRSS